MAQSLQSLAKGTPDTPDFIRSNNSSKFYSFGPSGKLLPDQMNTDIQAIDDNFISISILDYSLSVDPTERSYYRGFLIVSSSGFTFTRVKDQMIQELLDMGIKDFRVLDSLSQVPRHIFWTKLYGVELTKIEH